MYLFPIFASADIKKSLAQFFKMFKQVDNRWNNASINVKNNPTVIE